MIKHKHTVCSSLVCLATLVFSASPVAEEGAALASGQAPTAESSAVALAEKPPGILQLEISGLNNSAGDVYIAVFDSNDTWLGEETVLLEKVDIQSSLSGEMVVAEAQLPVGEYALTVFYDVNGNGDLDTNFIGMPKEPIALSNNAKARFGPPKYKDAKFNLGLEPHLQRIQMIVVGE
jgi:uncharacterized protein (DUF2141 family)